MVQSVVEVHEANRTSPPSHQLYPIKHLRWKMNLRDAGDSNFGDLLFCVSSTKSKSSLTSSSSINNTITRTMMQDTKHPHEAAASWESYSDQDLSFESYTPSSDHHRRLRWFKHGEESLEELESRKEEDFLANEESKSRSIQKKYEKKHRKRMRQMRRDPGVRYHKEHGIMIDAGSSGSRLHLYEFEPRILSSKQEVHDAVSGKKITFPYARSRWTDRLRPGVDSFAELPDDQLEQALREYLSPLLDFAKTVLEDKSDRLHKYPIYFRATAGMRILEQNDRSRVLETIRRLFNDKTFCPFMFEDEFARVLSGEEEAIFGWAGINFAMGTLVEETQGIGTVVNPKLTYGALDLGGASTQIAFYEDSIMANLFKLQIGQSKHWNVYGHSFLFFGMNAARQRFFAKLSSNADANTRLVSGVQNPCLPGGSKQEVRLKIHFDEHDHETFKFDPSKTTDGSYQAVLRNHQKTSNFEECLRYTKDLLHLDSNTWCNFAHQGQCSFNGVYMPRVPEQSKSFGEFLGFSNIYHVWDELQLPQRASMQELYDGTKAICNMSKDDAVEYSKRIGTSTETIEDLCFRSSYAYNLLSEGYGFQSDDYIIATDVVDGLKVGWSLGAMLYEINTLPWKIDESNPNFLISAGHENPIAAVANIMLFVVLALVGVAIIGTRKSHIDRKHYEPLKANVENYPTYT